MTCAYDEPASRCNQPRDPFKTTCDTPPPPCWPQISNPAELDAIFVAVGGGGLIAGIAAFVKALHPHVKVGRLPEEGPDVAVVTGGLALSRLHRPSP